ncbi:MAG: CPBP family intramembrane glutamic endopeptidase [Candidatus Acidiferrales bacterium]
MANDPTTPEQTQSQVPPRRLIAAPWHTLSILLIFAYLGFRTGMPSNTVTPGSAQPNASHNAVLLKYALLILSEWGMAYWAWVGVHWKGGNLDDLTGGRWTNWRGVATDVAIAIPFWIVWELTAWLVHWALQRIPSAHASYQPPTGFAEVTLWILLCISAGIGEEIVFRGYMQKQFQGATGSLKAAVILQGAIFGLAHAYQGWKQTFVIAVLGILYGALVAWRRNLRASMIAHAWSDIFEGWLRFL